MSGHITKKGKRLYVVYDAGQRWSAKAGKLVRRQVWEPVPSNTRREAGRMLNERLAQVQRGEWTETQPVTFAELAADWLEIDVRPRAKATTCVRYETALRVHLLPKFGGLPATSVGLLELQAFATRLIEGGTKVNTVRCIVSTARAALRAGVTWGKLRQDPAAGRMRYPQEARVEIQPLTQDEVRQLIEAAMPRYKTLLVFALGTGMRIGEVQAAKWCNLDLEGAAYHVRETVTQSGEFSTPKTASSGVAVALPPPVVAALRAHRGSLASVKLRKGEVYVDQGLLFSTDKGTPYFYTQLTRGLRRALSSAGMRKIRFHDLRHTCASTMIANGETPLAVMKQLRHSSIQQTMDTYGHLFPDKTDEAMSRLGDALFGGLDDF